MAKEYVGTEGGGDATEAPESLSGAAATRTALLSLIGERRHGGPARPWGEPERTEARVPLRAGGRWTVLSLDTGRDREVASCTNALGCLADMWRHTHYYLHADPAGRPHFYKTGYKVPWRITPAMEEWIDEFMWQAASGVEPGTACLKMMASRRAHEVAERLCGIKIMTRAALLRDLAYLEDHDHIEILDGGLREEHGPRPTSRGIGGYPPPGLMEYCEIEEELYWKRLHAGEPIPPEVLQFMEGNARERWYRQWPYPDAEPDGEGAAGSRDETGG